MHVRRNASSCTSPATWRPASRAGDPNNGGRLSVEPFECTWEMPDAGEHKPGYIGGGITLCKLKIGISNNIARDA